MFSLSAMLFFQPYSIPAAAMAAHNCLACTAAPHGAAATCQDVGCQLTVPFDAIPLRCFHGRESPLHLCSMQQAPPSSLRVCLCPECMLVGTIITLDGVWYRISLDSESIVQFFCRLTTCVLRSFKPRLFNYWLRNIKDSCSSRTRETCCSSC